MFALILLIMRIRWTLQQCIVLRICSAVNIKEIDNTAMMIFGVVLDIVRNRQWGHCTSSRTDSGDIAPVAEQTVGTLHQ